jgi:transcriptional regulator with XRE-family HTH domain
MSIQSSSITGIPAGFGQRLKEERKRLNLSQADFAEIAGCQRLAQLQYESEATAPTTRYLSAIASAGVDLSYLILGMRFGEGILTPEQTLHVEDKTFEWIEHCARRQPDGKLGPEAYKMLFRLFRGLLTQVELGQLPADLDPTLLISSQVSAPGKS